MGKIAITFRGLCTFVKREKAYEVYLLAGTQHVNCGGHGAHPAHLPSLAVNVESINTDPGVTTWKPDAIVYDQSKGVGVQIGIWKLDRRSVTLVPNKPLAGALPTWNDRHIAIDLEAHHEPNDAKAKMTADILKDGAAIVTLVDGSIASTEQFDKGGELKLIRNKALVSDGPFSKAITWEVQESGLKITLQSGGQAIELKENAVVTITNVAPVMGSKGLCHFEHYYEVFTQKPSDAKRLALEFNVMDEPVFDCVPPTAAPDPS